MIRGTKKNRNQLSKLKVTQPKKRKKKTTKRKITTQHEQTNAKKNTNDAKQDASPECMGM